MSTSTDDVSPTKDAAQAESGDDITKLWKGFDEKVKGHVDELVKGLNNQLDNLLLFASLFSAINTALLVYTLPTLSPSPQAQTDTLLYLLVQSLNNSTLSTLGNAAATNTHSMTSNVMVNALFTASLTCSLAASFSAVLGKQWLTYYSRYEHSSPEERRRELQRKIMGAEEWYLCGILEAGLSSLLQVALLLFNVGLVIFFRTINHTIAIINLTITAIGLATLVAFTFFVLRYDSCPYQTPLTMSIIPGFFRIIIWLTITASTSASFLIMGVETLFDGSRYMLHGRFSQAWTTLTGLWSSLGVLYDTSGIISAIATLYYKKIGQSLKHDVKDCQLHAASLAWLFINSRDKAELHSLPKAVLLINDREALQLGFFARDYGRSRLYESTTPTNHANPELDVPRTPFLHIFVTSSDVGHPLWIAKRLMNDQPVVDSPEESTESNRNLGLKFPVPAPLYIAVALRSILDHRVYFRWRHSMRYPHKEMDKLDAKLRSVITSCSTRSAPSQVVSMVALALNITIGKEFHRTTPHAEVHKSQKADYEAIWSSYMSDEPFVKNLAWGILVYAKHRKTPPEKAVWPSEPQFTSLLLASQPYIKTKASAKQLEVHGLDLIFGCANLLTGPHKEMPDGDMIEAAGGLINMTVQRVLALEDSSTGMLMTEVEMLKVLSGLFPDHHYGAILDSFSGLMEHCQNHLNEGPGDLSLETSSQISHGVAAPGRVPERLDDEDDDISKVTSSVGHIVDFIPTDWQDDSTTTAPTSNPTMLARFPYIKRLFNRGGLEGNQGGPGTADALAGGTHLASLLEEGKRKKLREELKRLQDLMNPEKAALVGEEAEIMPQTVLTSLE